MKGRRGSTWNRTSALSPATIGAIILRDGGKCAYCGERVPQDAIEFDHVVPRSEGGSNDARNLVLACGPCNNTRGSSPVPESARAEVDRRLARPIDRRAGRALGDELYPWAAARRQAWREGFKRREAHARRMAEAPEDTSFGFGYGEAATV